MKMTIGMLLATLFVLGFIPLLIPTDNPEMSDEIRKCISGDWKVILEPGERVLNKISKDVVEEVTSDSIVRISFRTLWNLQVAEYRLECNGEEWGAVTAR